VHDIVVHPRDNDLIIATHGRSVWILDDATAIQQMNEQVAASDAHLFDVRPALRHTTRFTRYGIGDKPFTGPNPPYGALITYYLKDKPDDKTAVKVEIIDASGKVVNEMTRVPKEKGVNRVAWDLRYGGPRLRRPPTDEETAFFGGPRGPQALPGTYTVKLTVGNKTIEKRVEVRLDSTVSVPAEELRSQLDMSLKLRDMQSAGNDSLRALDSIKQQIEQIEKTVKDRMPDAPQDLTKALADHKKQVETLSESVSRPQGGLGFSGRAMVVDRVGSLFFTIDAVNAGPTAPQREYFAALQTEFQQKMDEVNKYLSQSVAQLNETLRRHNAPTVIAGKPVDVPR
jgi:hypothetical protein